MPGGNFRISCGNSGNQQSTAYAGNFDNRRVGIVRPCWNTHTYTVFNLIMAIRTRLLYGQSGKYKTKHYMSSDSVTDNQITGSPAKHTDVCPTDHIQSATSAFTNSRHSVGS